MSQNFVFTPDLHRLPQKGAIIVLSDESTMNLQRVDDPAEREAHIKGGGIRQRAVEAGAYFGEPDSLFCSLQHDDTNVNWTCRAFKVLKSPSERPNSGRQQSSDVDHPPQPKILDANSGQTETNIGEESNRTVASEHSAAAFDENSRVLYLFNVLVALEWMPTESEWAQLEWAFRRASDFLYDVTNGQMAFGQVVFGGLELMDIADIQILASNRLYPRSWVGGLIDQATYRPIRVGRGMWHRRNRVSIPWAEPESYRTLVHEWGHYALGLSDDYLEVDDEKHMRVPAIRLASTSIMATVEGTSELSQHAKDRRTSQERKDDEWDTMDDQYKQLARTEVPFSGPGRLPLPLPSYCYNRKTPRFVNRQGGTLWMLDTPGKLMLDPALLPFEINNSDQASRCWIFVLKSDKHENLIQQLKEGRLDETGKPSLTAQGTLDARYADPFPLLGAEAGDVVLVIDSTNQGVRRTYYAGLPLQPEPQWVCSVSKTDTPLIAVTTELLPPKPNGDQAESGGAAETTGVENNAISIRIYQSPEPLPTQVWVFPIGQGSEPQSYLVPANDAVKLVRNVQQDDWYGILEAPVALDGHVLALNGTGQLVLATYSQGGNAPGHGTVPTNPISAGSTDGDVMLFFFDKNQLGPDGDQGPNSGQDYSKIRVTTTLNYGDVAAPEGINGRCGYVYSLTTTAELKQELLPTLVIYYDPLAVGQQNDPVLYRRTDGGEWVYKSEAVIYRSNSCVALALRDEPERPNWLNRPRISDYHRVEHYRLCWPADTRN